MSTDKDDKASSSSGFKTSIPEPVIGIEDIPTMESFPDTPSLELDQPEGNFNT